MQATTFAYKEETTTMLFDFTKRLTIAAAFILMSVVTLSAQNLTIKGTVTDASNSAPLTGAMVRVSGGGNAVITGLQGDYSIRANKGDVLEFSYLGMKTETITIADQTQIDVSE